MGKNKFTRKELTLLFNTSGYGFLEDVYGRITKDKDGNAHPQVLYRPEWLSKKLHELRRRLDTFMYGPKCVLSNT